MSVPTISVIMPTHNRRDVLLRTLDLYRNQTLASAQYEIIVSDDGSTDGSEAAVTDFATQCAFALIYSRLADNAGPSVARNRAMMLARGSILVFVGDDIFPERDFLEQHLVWHREVYPDERAGVLGRVEWSEELGSTPLMRWLETEGTQFAYGRMVHGQVLDYGCLYTCNVSVKRAFLERTGERFCEELRFCEDSEWGLRLAQWGFELRYNAQARAKHFHPVSLSSSLSRMVALGRSTEALAKVSPTNFRRMINADRYEHRPLLAKMLSILLHPLAGRFLYRPLAAFCERRLAADRIFAICHASYFYRGLASKRLWHNDKAAG
ncbi:glycosyltransferase involved in cell wall biosynthesis [Pararhizobium capsulatum DSM 1112]|uniref:Glycosyltransferase involved in cell wall biosynthesis n=1 Tax=Pararhizobium capsulatum DSM 1112 TaxID=1121113 RepID=A0ABU0BS55_9HYPH|nr:glycosyltransferase family 2 protein [Pararhizobium capsulatum]MDQ0321093.1 glycosyltransferase involved in cell wall biosynthesis [Pararhizobium capsulatum DSM 1112]